LGIRANSTIKWGGGEHYEVPRKEKNDCQKSVVSWGTKKEPLPNWKKKRPKERRGNMLTKGKKAPSPIFKGGFLVTRFGREKKDRFRGEGERDYPGLWVQGKKKEKDRD